MAWQDYLKDDEAAEYNEAREAKKKTDNEMQRVIKKYKPRCDARMRRDPMRSDPESRSKTDVEESQDGTFRSNKTSNKGADE